MAIPVFTTQGGARVATVFSGGLLSPGSGFLPTGAVKTADQLLLLSGIGRLNAVHVHTVISGIQINFYDSAVVARSGGLIESGYRVLAVVPANTIGAFGNSLGGGPLPLFPNTPFTSGLCVSCVSGTPGFSVTYSVETDNTKIF